MPTGSALKKLRAVLFLELLHTAKMSGKDLEAKKMKKKIEGKAQGSSGAAFRFPCIIFSLQAFIMIQCPSDSMNIRKSAL